MTTTSRGTITLHLSTSDQPGAAIMESGDPWYRLIRAAADLFLSGEIDLDELTRVELFCQTIYDMQGRATRQREIACPAARQLLGFVALATLEPSCMCIANWEGPPCVRGCEPLDRRARLRQLMGG